jgi:hypothetical protein
MRGGGGMGGGGGSTWRMRRAKACVPADAAHAEQCRTASGLHRTLADGRGAHGMQCVARGAREQHHHEAHLQQPHVHRDGRARALVGVKHVPPLDGERHALTYAPRARRGGVRVVRSVDTEAHRGQMCEPALQACDPAVWRARLEIFVHVDGVRAHANCGEWDANTDLRGEWDAKQGLRGCGQERPAATYPGEDGTSEVVASGCFRRRSMAGSVWPAGSCCAVAAPFF